MSHWRRVVLVAMFLISLLVLIVFLTRVAGPMFNVAEGMAIASPSSPFNGAYEFIKEVSYLLIVPVFALTWFLWLVFGPAQDELQKERRRRGL